jgi:NADH:ubiquinone oxidoreductase subunit 2 (subunit N)
MLEFFQFILILFVVPSLAVGALALKSQTIKGVLAFTTVSQIGFVLIGVASASVSGFKFSFLYLLIYCLQITCVLTVLLLLNTKHRIFSLSQLSMIKLVNRRYYYGLLLVIFSLCGVPPIAGFYIKYFVLLQTYLAGLFFMTFLGLLSGYLMAIIYLQVALEILAVPDARTNWSSLCKVSPLHSRFSSVFFYLKLTKGLEVLLIILFVLFAGFFVFLPFMIIWSGNFTFF